MQGAQPLVSACMIVKDEEQHLGRCLQSLRGLADEIVVVDTGSNDRTAEIAESFGARVYHEPWRNDFAFHRNQALDRATGKWLFVIDADEEVVETDCQATRGHLSDAPLPSVLLVREVLQYPAGRSITMLTPRFILRASGIRYEFPIHEQLNARNADAALSNVRLLHHGYAAEDGLRAKEARNLRIAKEMPEGSMHALHCQLRSAHSLGHWEDALDAGMRLLAVEGLPPLLEVEGCVLAASACYNLARWEPMKEFLRRGLALAPDAPDLLYVAFLAAGQQYHDALDSGDSNSPGEFLRPWMFWHDREQVSVVMEVLSGRSRAVRRGPLVPPEASGEEER